MVTEPGGDHRLRPTWEPAELADWCAAGGPLHGTGTLADLCALAPGDPVDRNAPDGLLDARVAELESSGVGCGDVVAWQLPNRPDSVVMYRACWSIGAIAAPLHHLAGGAEVESTLAGLSPAAFLPPDGALELPTGVAVRAFEREEVRESDIAVVLHTSGSSGRAKGVMHTHRALAYKARTMAEVHGLGRSDAVLMPAPLAHVSGLLNGILVPAAAGMRAVLMGRWDPAEALDIIESERITFMVGPPTFFLGLESAPGFSPDRVASLRLLSVGGAGVTPEFVERTSQTFGAVVKRSYGSTEAPTVATSTDEDDDWARANTDGRAVGAVRIRTVDPVTGHATDAGVPGEVQVSGPELFCGYLDPEQTETATTRDAGGGDWYRTGDLGVLDEEGRLSITGRLGNVIIRGGENVDAAEVEAHLVAHPAVSAAVAVAEPDDRLGERVVAVVELVGSERGFDLATCRTWFESRGVARFKTPERIVTVAQIPLLASGKADRVRVAESVQPD